MKRLESKAVAISETLARRTVSIIMSMTGYELPQIGESQIRPTLANMGEYGCREFTLEEKGILSNRQDPYC